MNTWVKRNLTPLGRITVLKSLMLPTLNHLFSSLPNPSENEINLFKTNAFLLCARGKYKKGKVKRNTLVQNYIDGGLKVPLIKETIQAKKNR